MQQVARETRVAFERRLERARVPAAQCHRAPPGRTGGDARKPPRAVSQVLSEHRTHLFGSSGCVNRIRTLGEVLPQVHPLQTALGWPWQGSELFL